MAKPALISLYFLFVVFCIGCAGKTTKTKRVEIRNETQEFFVYCDFQCPFCMEFFKALIAGSRVERKSPIVHFEHFPFHQKSIDLARFYEAALISNPEVGEKLIEILYEHRREPNLFVDVKKSFQSLTGGAELLLQLDPQKINRDKNARDVSFRINESMRKAVILGVNHTPTVFANGMKLPEMSPRELAVYILQRSATVTDPGPAECSQCRSPSQTGVN